MFPGISSHTNALLKSRKAGSRVLVMGLLVVLVVLVGWKYLPPGIDWGGNYRLASLALLSGKSPYTVEKFFAPPWSLLPLLPFAVLPEALGRSLLFWLSIVAFAFVAYRLKAKPLGTVAFLLSPPVMHCLLNANIEWIPLLGFVMPPQIGLLFVMAKPQTGFAVALFWIIDAWRKGGLRQIIHISWPLLSVLFLSMVLFGLWPLHLPDIMTAAEGINASLWPYTIPVGLALVVASIQKREMRFAMGASPCLSPYVLFHGWTGALAAIAPSTAELLGAVVGLWILVAIRGASGIL